MAAPPARRGRRHLDLRHARPGGGVRGRRPRAHDQPRARSSRSARRPRSSTARRPSSSRASSARSTCSPPSASATSRSPGALRVPIEDKLRHAARAARDPLVRPEVLARGPGRRDRAAARDPRRPRARVRERRRRRPDRGAVPAPQQPAQERRRPAVASRSKSPARAPTQRRDRLARPTELGPNLASSRTCKVQTATRVRFPLYLMENPSRVV